MLMKSALACLLAAGAGMWCVSRLMAAEPAAAVAKTSPLYKLGPGDEVQVHQVNAEELDGISARVDDNGFVNLPLIGRVQVGGLTVEQSEGVIGEKLSALLKRPQPVVAITEYRSQPVSVLGAVNTPGVIQLQGHKTLAEVISLTGGLRPDAGAKVQITRKTASGPLPLPGAVTDPSGQFSTATIDMPNLLTGKAAETNLQIMPNDLISVPKAEVVYVTGDVKKPGGFPMSSNGGISALQGISLAEGLGPQAAPKEAKIFRLRGDGQLKDEVPVDMASVLAGKTPDVDLKPGDVLFIPDNKTKKAGVRAAEVALQAVVGLAWRPW
jgi:polysaccharide export outer membrane protein